MFAMLFWVTAAAMTLIACAAILWPMTRRGEATAPSGYDAEVYKDQLAEIERDAQRGLIAPAQAELARAEVARRLLKASALAEKGAAGGSSQSLVRWSGLAAVLSVPLVAWGFYLAVGAAGMPGDPLSARLSRDPATSSVEELVARAEKHLADNPDDARGWSVIAPVYLRQQRYAEARTAYENTIRLLGSDADREIGLGEAITGVAGGIVTADARAAFERAVALNPGEPRARYFLATALAQEGRLVEAHAAWEQMKSTLPPDSPWHNVISAAQQNVAERVEAGRQVADTAEATKDMTAEERQSMIEGMVASLDARLRDDPADVDGWQRLIRSYLVLGRKDAAEDALTRAITALADNAAALETVTRFAADLGVGRGG